MQYEMYMIQMRHTFDMLNTIQPHQNIPLVVSVALMSGEVQWNAAPEEGAGVGTYIITPPAQCHRVEAPYVAVNHLLLVA